MAPIRVRVPGSTSNLAHGFDCMGLAVDLINTITLEPGASDDGPLDAFASQVRHHAGAQWGVTVPPFRLAVAGEVPISRGLGSSATILVGAATACRQLLGLPPDPAAVIAVAEAIEGHPDNVVAATLGGFTVAGPDRAGTLRFQRFDPPAGLRAILAIPEHRQSTTDARAVLGDHLDRATAVRAWQRCALITAAMASGRSADLRGLFGDGWHEAERAARNPGLAGAISAAADAGAVGTFLSGSGSTVLSLVEAAAAEPVTAALSAHYRDAGIACTVRSCGFDRDGARVESA